MKFFLWRNCFPVGNRFSRARKFRRASWLAVWTTKKSHKAHNWRSYTMELKIAPTIFSYQHAVIGLYNKDFFQLAKIRKQNSNHFQVIYWAVNADLLFSRFAQRVTVKHLSRTILAKQEATFRMCQTLERNKITGKVNQAKSQSFNANFFVRSICLWRQNWKLTFTADSLRDRSKLQQAGR